MGMLLAGLTDERPLTHGTEVSLGRIWGKTLMIIEVVVWASSQSDCCVPRANVTETGSAGSQFLNAWAWKWTQHHFHHILLVKQYYGLNCLPPKFLC